MKKALYILGELDDSDVEWMIARGRKERFAADSVLIHEGASIDALYLVLDGYFSVCVASLGNQEVARLGAGEIVGEMSYVDNRPTSATVRATEDSLVLSIPRPELTARLQQDDAFAARFYRSVSVFLADRLRVTMRRFGAERGGPVDMGVQEMDLDEMDVDQLEKVSRAGRRFQEILKRLRGLRP